MIGSQIQLWKLEKFDDDIESEELEFQTQTKEEISKHLLYFRTRMKLELDRKLSDSDPSYIINFLKKQVCLLDGFILII